MWDYNNRVLFAEFATLQIPSNVGRRLDIGGFVFTDPFDVFLRRLSEQYLSQAWEQLVLYLEAYKLDPKDLSWGCPHPGETRLPGLIEEEPHQFIGWTSQELALFYKDVESSLLDEDLAKLTPQLRCVSTWRSLKWEISPTDFSLALRLIEACCTDDLGGWYPLGGFPTTMEVNYTWQKAVKAISDKNQKELDLALQKAESEYSPLGYRIVRLAADGLKKWLWFSSDEAE